MSVRILFAALAATSVLTLSACNGDSAPEPIGTAPREASDPAPAPTDIDTAQDPDLSPEATPGSTDSNNADADEQWVEAPEIAREAPGTTILGSWRASSGAEVVVAASDAESLSPEDYFSENFGGIGPDDGLDIQHQIESTEQGDPLLLVQVSPQVDVGGSSEAIFVIFQDDQTITGSMSAPDGFTDFDLSTFNAIGSKGAVD